MRRKFGFRPSKRERIAANNAALTLYASASERPDAQANLQRLLTPVPPPRRRGARAISDMPLEAAVIRSVGQLLAVHPRVAFALRMNAGSASYEAASGKWAPVNFHTWIKPNKGFRMSDYLGATKDKLMIAFECKREDFKGPRDQRECEQAAFLQMVLDAGGIAAFIRHADEAKILLDGRIVRVTAPDLDALAFEPRN